MTTPSQTVGPFFHYALPSEDGQRLVAEDTPGSFTLSGRVYDGNGDPVTDALVEIWQADPSGRFGARGFGRCATDGEGRYWFRTVKPGSVPAAGGRPQAPHIAMAIFARGLLRQVVTRVYFPDEAAANAADPLLVSLGDDRRATLVARTSGDGLLFDVRLQGEKETVFLDVFAP